MTIEHNGLRRILIGVATVVIAAVIMGMVGLYADVRQIQGNRFAIGDAYSLEMRLRDAWTNSLTEAEVRLREEWLEGLNRIEVAIEQLRLFHMEGR